MQGPQAGRSVVNCLVAGGPGDPVGDEDLVVVALGAVGLGVGGQVRPGGAGSAAV